MTIRRPKLLAGGALGALAGVVLTRRRRRRGAAPEIRGELLEKAREWVVDAGVPEHVRDVARRILDASHAAASAPVAASIGRKRGLRRH